MRQFPLVMYSSLEFMKEQFDSTRGHSHNGVDGEQTSESFSDQNTGVPGRALYLYISFNESTTNWVTTAWPFTLRGDINNGSITLKPIAATYRSTTIQLIGKKENHHLHCHSTTLDMYAKHPLPRYVFPLLLP